jgi:oligosaccharyltransferase complex subunit epsilon
LVQRFALGAWEVALSCCVILGGVVYGDCRPSTACVVASLRAVSLRMQMTSAEFETRSKERAFADFVVCNVVLFLVVTNFMG